MAKRDLDFVKAVIEDEADLDWVRQFLNDHETDAQVCIGPRWKGEQMTITPAALVTWMRRKELWNWRLNLQLHKYIWHESVAPGVADLGEVDYDSRVKKEV